jgi:hypothetical protein
MTRIRFRIRVSHGAFPGLICAWILLPAIIILLVAANSVASTGRPPPAGASATVSALTTLDTQRSFYLTRTLHPATGAPGACAGGYHFASIWEIADPSSLRYNTALGLRSPDGGSGPPTATKLWTLVITAEGWVRTGNNALASTPVGQANCLAWSSDSESHYGSMANLPSDWTAGEQDIGAWNAEASACDRTVRVWCVQDDSLWRAYLPLVIHKPLPD